MSVYLPIRTEEPLPEAPALDHAELEAPLRQLTTATQTKPVVSEEPTTTQTKPVISEEPAVQREPQAKTSLDQEQREPEQKETPITWDPLAALLSRTFADVRETPTIESPQPEADLSTSLAIETPQSETDHDNDETNTPSETPSEVLPPQAQAQASAESSTIPAIKTPQNETDQATATDACPCPLALVTGSQAQAPADSSAIPADDETSAASETQHEPVDASKSQQRNTQYTRTRRPPKTRVRARGEKVNILKVQGKRVINVKEVANLRVVTAVDVVSPAVFLWESKDGVFAVGRSINIQFSETGSYTITVTAQNDFGTDKETLTITVKEPPTKPPEEGG